MRLRCMGLDALSIVHCESEKCTHRTCSASQQAAIRTFSVHLSPMSSSGAAYTNLQTYSTPLSETCNPKQ